MSEPLTPADCDLRDFQYMPLDVERLRRSKAWILCKRQPELAFYMLNLWSASWHEIPAASLEDDDDVLADAAMCDVKKWRKIKDILLRGWIKCSDGRLYHPVVAEKALSAWDRRTKATRKGRDGAAKRWANAAGNPPTNAAAIVEAKPADSKGEGEGKGKGEEEASASLRSAGAAAPPADEARKPPDPATQLWREGLAILANLTKRGDTPCRKALGKMLDAIGGDHAALMAILRKAETEQPDGPIAWIRAAINSQSGLLAPIKGDPWGINAWIARQPDAAWIQTDAGERVVGINGHMVLLSAQMVADAVGLPESWRGSWDAMGTWMRDDLMFTVEKVLRAMGNQARRMGVELRAMAVFDSTVRMNVERLFA